MGVAANAAMFGRKSIGQKDALRLLDIICEPWRGCDAEFEAEDPDNIGNVHPDYADYTDFNAQLGKLIAAAFTPEKKWKLPAVQIDRDECPVWTAWYETAERKFRERYEFC